MAEPGEKNPILEAIGGFATTLLSSRGGERLKGGGIYGPNHAVAAAVDLATILMTPSLLEPHLDAAARRHKVPNIITGKVVSAPPTAAEKAAAAVTDEVSE